MRYDLDESENTDTFEAAFQGVSYTIPFALIASIVAPGGEHRGSPHAKLILHGGDELRLERTGDLGDRNAGVLVFIAGAERPEYVPWSDVAQIDLAPPPTATSRRPVSPAPSAPSRSRPTSVGGRQSADDEWSSADTNCPAERRCR